MSRGRRAEWAVSVAGKAPVKAKRFKAKRFKAPSVTVAYLFLACCCFLISAFFVGAGVIGLVNNIGLQDEGETAPAKVLSVTSGLDATADVVFTTREGKQVNATIHIDDWEVFPSVGDTPTIQYNPTAPETAIDADMSVNLLAVPLLVWGIASIPGVGGRKLLQLRSQERDRLRFVAEREEADARMLERHRLRQLQKKNPA